MRTLLAIATTAALTTTALAAPFPLYADGNRDGITTQEEYEAYAFDRADQDDDGFISENERHRFDRLMDLDQEF